jgi:PEP-CTERM motif-containing protein
MRTNKYSMMAKAMALLGGAALALNVGVARADLFDFQLNIGNTALNPPNSGPYANVDVNLTSPTTATITFTSLTNSGNIYLMGDGGSVGVNVNATSWTLGTITGSNAGTGFTPGPYSDGGAGNEDGFGSFNQTINSFDGFTHSSDTISFTLTDTSGTWASAASVLTNNVAGAGNPGGSLAAAHIFITSFPADASNGAIVTGFAASSPNGGGPGNFIPEPGSLALLGMAVLGLGAVVRRRS